MCAGSVCWECVLTRWLHAGPCACRPPPLPPRSQDPPGSFRLSSQAAPFTRLTPVGIDTPTSHLPMPFAEEEYYMVEMQREYSKQLPSIERSPDVGGWHEHAPGFHM